MSNQTKRGLFVAHTGFFDKTGIYIFLMALLLSRALSAGAQGSGCPTPSFAPALNYLSGEASFIAVGDFNSDGKEDIAMTNYPNSVGVFLNNGNGTFAPVVTYPSGGNSPSSIAVGDFNADGKADLAVTNYFSNIVGVLLNNGNGTFAPVVTYPSGGSNPNEVVAGDFNGDGKVDLAVANAQSSTVTILLNSSNATFAAAEIYSSGGIHPFFLAAEDFNNDGKIDLAVTNYESSTIAVLLNSGSGVFAAPIIYPSGGIQPYSLAVGDFNGDGKKDLAVTSLGFSTVAVLLNSGSGVFAAPIIYPSGGVSPTSIAAGDFNSDGKVDLAVANANSHSVAVLLNNGNGSFAPAVTFPSGGELSQSLAVGDFNSDGKMDLVVTNIFPTTVGVLLNTCSVSCPTITITIPNALALPSGALPNTIYLGYAPASSITLTANVSGGTGPYNFTWSTGSHDPSITVSPTQLTTYAVSVTDANGCTSNTASITINTIDVRSGKNGDKVLICHKAGKSNNTLSVATEAVAAHLAHGDMLSTCEASQAVVYHSAYMDEQGIKPDKLTLANYPNPFGKTIRIQYAVPENARVSIKIFDLTGREIGTVFNGYKTAGAYSFVYNSSSLKHGVYYCQMIATIKGKEYRQTQKLVKGN